MTPLRVLIVAPSLDGNDIGEVEWAFSWIKALARQADVTVLSSSRPGTIPLARQLPEARVFTWPEPAFLSRKFERFNAMAKPAFPLFAWHVRRWIRAALSKGERFDIAHQMLPQAMRYTSPLRGLGIPYVIGPLGGALETPAPFRAEVRQGASLASRLRAVDDFRLRHDPWLRAGYAQASMILGVAPYVAERLATVGIKRFRAMMERSCGALPPETARDGKPGQLRMFHAGRAVRTKGLRDVVRAMALLRELPGVTLISAGDGEDLPACRAEAEKLGVADRVTFLGRIPRAAVEEEYARADAFCFPSFREPMGGVLFEAMAHGLPVITAARGGPDFIIDETCGLRIPVTTPEQFPRDIAAAVRKLALEPDLRLQLGRGARARLTSLGSWEDKASAALEIYRAILERDRPETEANRAHRT